MSEVNSVTISIERFKALEAIEKSYDSKIVELKQEFASVLQKDFVEISRYWPDYQPHISTALSRDEVYIMQKNKISELTKLLAEAKSQTKLWYKFWK